jgi:predicted AlkP superfamily pyrophosphatase or phosphodiesterase
VSQPPTAVLLVIIDALASRVILPAMEQGKLPTFSALAAAGELRPESIAIFPSLTPAATSSIVTGAYPAEHNIIGFHWFDEESGQEVYYGDDFWVVAKAGFGEFFRDCLSRLNNSRLKATTVFQKVEREEGRSASLNFLMFHGDTPHTAKVPLWFSWHPGVPREQEVKGPQVLFFGDLVDSSQQLDEDAPSRKGGLLGRFGFNDSNTAELLLTLAGEDPLPRFTVAYFPDNDYRSHEVGPLQAVEDVMKVDAALAAFLDKMGGLEKALEQVCILITGDHSQTDMSGEEKVARIRLEEVLSAYSIAEAGSWPQDKQLKICPDMRCAQVYARDKSPRLLAELTRALLADQRVDQVLQKDGEQVLISTRERGQLRFWIGGQGESAATGTDPFGNRWSWQGSLAAVDGRCENGKLTFETYPNAFERVYGCLGNPSAGDLWVTCYPGSEFAIPETSIHLGGGSHGSLHKDDSTSPLIVAGHKPDVHIPRQPRTVDLAPICLQQLGIESIKPGQGHFVKRGS